MSVPKASDIVSRTIPALPNSTEMKQKTKEPAGLPKTKSKRDVFELDYIRNRYERFSDLEEYQSLMK